MTLDEMERLVRDKARRLKHMYPTVYFVSKDPQCPAEFRHGVTIGTEPDIRRFYGASRKEVLEEALVWANKPKNK